MADKVSEAALEDTTPPAYNEKDAARAAAEPALVDAGGRRQSVAKNIVHNPLQVHSLSTIYTLCIYLVL